MTRPRAALDLIEGEYQQWFKGEKTLPGTVGAKDPYPKIVRDALNRFKSGGDQDTYWVWFHSSSQQDRDEFERYLVHTNDPLASQPGSPEWRFKAFIQKVVKGVENILGGEYR